MKEGTSVSRLKGGGGEIESLDKEVVHFKCLGFGRGLIWGLFCANLALFMSVVTLANKNGTKTD